MKNSIITDLSVKEMQEVNGGGRNTARGLQRVLQFIGAILDFIGSLPETGKPGSITYNL